MTIWQGIRFVAAIAGQLMAALMLVGFGYFVARYYVDAGSNLRHEYLFAASILLLYALGTSLVSALLAASIKSVIRRVHFRALVWPALFLGAGFLVLYFGSLVFEFASRT